jgi:putative phosphonate metabolism protein
MRAAIYFTPPPEHALARTAAAWLGRDAWTGARLDRGPVEGLDAEAAAALTAEPRRYGFHATLKPPFRLAEGRSLAALRAALDAFCRTRPPVRIAALRLEAIGSFFALTPAGDSAAVDELAAAVVRTFDRFRAQLTAEEAARRHPERLTPRRREHLAAWGYPYVLDEFRFHMTLTGPVPERQRGAIAAVLRRRFAGFIGAPLAVDRLCLFVEHHAGGDFTVDAAFRLKGGDA